MGDALGRAGRRGESWAALVGCWHWQAERGEGDAGCGVWAAGERGSGWAAWGVSGPPGLGWEKGEWAMGRFGLDWAVSWVSCFGFGFLFSFLFYSISFLFSIPNSNKV